MYKIENGGLVKAEPAEQRGAAASYPLYRKDTDGGTVAVNSFTDEAWFIPAGEAAGGKVEEILKKLAKGPPPETLRAEAELEEAKAAAESPSQIGFCPTYACNMRCEYCYQQNNPELDKRPVTEENLLQFLEYAEKFAVRARAGRADRAVVLQLFGGEPFSGGTKAAVKKLFEFCRQHKLHIAATSNGLALHDFFDLLLPYHGYISRIGISVDGVGDSHDSRRKVAPASGGFSRIVSNINVLLKAGIHVSISHTLDSSNIGRLPEFLKFTGEQGWNDNPLVDLTISRVDDRKFETGYAAILSEAQLYKALLDLDSRSPFPGNVRLAFLNASLPFAKKLGKTFGHNENVRGRFKYCWAASGINDLVYVDPKLDVFRCTYTVGETKRKVGSLAGGFSLESWRANSTWARKECAECPIGGYCRGGCPLSAQKDFDRNCKEEKANFEYLVENVVEKKIAALLEGAGR